MEDGILTDSTGRKVSFKNAIVVMTSNAGSQVRGEGLGFCASGKEAEVGAAVRECFSPEFLGRVDGVVHFSPLDNRAMEQIILKYLRQLQQRTSQVGTQLAFPPELAGWLLKKAGGKDGARQFRRLVQNEVEGPLASYLLGCSRKPGKVQITLDDGKLLFST